MPDIPNEKPKRRRRKPTEPQPAPKPAPAPEPEPEPVVPQPAPKSPRKPRPAKRISPTQEPVQVIPNAPTEDLKSVAAGMWVKHKKKLMIIVGSAVLLMVVLFGCSAMIGGEDAPLPTPTPEPTATPEPTPTPVVVLATGVPVMVVATPTLLPARPLVEIVPLNQMGYNEYRFYHAWEEYSRCQLEYADTHLSEEITAREEVARLEAEVEALGATAAAPTPVPEDPDGESTSTPLPTPVPLPTNTPEPAPTLMPDPLAEQAFLVNLRTEVRWLLERYEGGDCYEGPEFSSVVGRTQWLLWASGYKSGGETGESVPSPLR